MTRRVKTSAQRVSDAMAPSRRELRARERQKQTPDVQVLTSHHHLQWWKDEYYQDYAIDKDYQAVKGFPLDKASIKTIVPNRYLHIARNERNVKRNHGRRSRLEFPGAVEIQNGVRAIKNAYAEHTQILDPTRLVLWTDGSCVGRHGGMAIVYREVVPTQKCWSPWTALGFKSMGHQVGSTEMESIAIIKACDIAKNLIKKRNGLLKDVVIYTDSTTDLENVRASTPRPLTQFIIKRAKALVSLGVDVTMTWCPAHSKVPGNELADRVAGYAGKYQYDGDDEFIDLSSDDEGEAENTDHDRDDRSQRQTAQLTRVQ